MRSNNAPSPGPWFVQPLQADHGASLAVVSNYGGEPFVIATIPPVNEDDEPDYDDAVREPCDEANARLIAAAPELREALASLVAYLDTSCMSEGEAGLLAPARALLARLEGR